MSMPLTGAVAGSVPEGITNPPDRRPARPGELEVRAGDLRGQARPPDQRLLLAARRGPAGVRRPAGRAGRRGRSRCRSPCARSRPACSSTPRASSNRRRWARPRRAGAARGGRRHRRLQERASCCGGSPRPGTRCGCCPPRPRWSSSARPPSRRCPGSRCTPACSPTCPRCRTSRLGQQADLVVVAPATADLLARAAHGRADDLLTATLLTARCPVLMAPAMHTEMWLHPATRDNVALLRSRGVVVHGARVRPADRRRHRPRPAARSRSRSPSWPGCCWSGRRRCRATWPAGGWSCPRAAPGSRWTRCGSSATGPRAGRATRWPRWRRSAAPR